MTDDNYRHKGLRKKLVAELREKGIDDERVLDAIGRVPRHLFMDNAFLKFAYADQAFPIGAGQTISQPYTVARQTMLLDVKKGEKVLEVGTGSGYQTCILLELGAKVFSVERQHELYLTTKALLPSLGYTARIFYGDGYKGLPAFAPFDKILVTAGAPLIPEPLIGQLRVGGKLVVPLGKGEVQTMTVLTRESEADVVTEEFGQFRFVPLLEDKAGGG